MSRKNREDFFSETRKATFTTWMLNLIVVPIILVNLLEKHPYVVIFAAIFLLALNSGIYFFKRKHNVKGWSDFVLALLALGVLAVFYTGGEDKAGLFWSFLFPILAIELKGYRKALKFILSFMISILVLYAISFAPFSSNHYSLVFFLFYFLVLFSVSAFSYAYDRRKHDTEADIRYSKEKLETLYNHLPLGVVMIDKEMRVMEANARMQEWFPELKKDEKYYCYQILNPDKTGKICNECPVKSSLSDGKVHVYEKRKLTSEGEKFNRIMSKPLRDSKGSIYAVLETLEDITSQKQYEKQLRESEEQIRALTDHSQAGIYMYRDNHFIMVNPATCHITGYSREELFLMSNLDFVHPEERQKITDIATKRLRGENVSASYELRIITKSGETRWIQHSVSLINHDGKPTSIGTIFDITDRKRAESDLEFNYRFQQLVANISQNFITATPANIDEKIDITLRQCGEILQTDRTFFFQFSDDLSMISNTHEWCAPGIMPVKDIVQNCPVEEVSWIAKIIKNREFFYVPDVDDLSEEYQKEKHELKKQMIKSVFVIPVVNNDRLLGYFGYDAVKEKRTVDENQISLLQIIANILGDAMMTIETDKEIKDVNDRFYKLAYQNRTITWELDSNGLYTFISPVVKHVLGYEPGEIIGKMHFYDLFPEELKNEYLDRINAVIDSKQSFEHFQNPVVSKNGDIVWMETNSLPLFSEKGEMIGITGSDTDITKRKKAEESLKQSEEKYRLITENATDVIWILNLEKNKYTYISPSVYQLRGLTVQEALNEKFEDSLTQDSLEIVKRKTKESVERFSKEFPVNRQTQITQIQQPCKNGKIIWVEVSTQLQINTKGEMEVLGVSRNIDGRKKMEESIQYQSEMRKLISDISSLFISYNDENFNLNMYQAIADASEFFGANRCHFYKFNKKEKNYQLSFEYVEKGFDAFDQELRYFHPSDYKWWFHSLEKQEYIEVYDIKQLADSASPEHDQLSRQSIQSFIALPLIINQKLSGFIIFDSVFHKKKWSVEQIAGMRIVANILSDAIEKNRAEKELRKSEIENKKTAARFQEFIFASNTGAWEYNIETGFLWCSELYFTMLGRNINDFTFDGQPNATNIWKELIHPEDFAKAVKNFEHYQNNPSGIYEQIFRMMHKNGNPRWILSRGKLLKDEKGGHTSLVVGTHIDITDQKHYEQTIISKNKELESYLYVTSHDLRSPLVNIQGFGKRVEKQLSKIIEKLEQNPVSEDQKKELIKIAAEQIPNSLSFIFTNVQKMDNLIKGLLTISRTGRVKMKPQHLDMNALIKKVVRSFAYQTDEIGAVIRVDDLPDCFGDENLLNQLFSNLIDNAIKYRNHQKKFNIHISGRHLNGMVEYAVKDNGIGVSEKNKIKIWDVFFRVDPHSEAQGDGIGLNLVTKIVEKHHGFISMDSEEGQGSTFWVKLSQNPFDEE